jgi:hypothetical protein
VRKWAPLDQQTTRHINNNDDDDDPRKTAKLVHQNLVMDASAL